MNDARFGSDWSAPPGERLGVLYVHGRVQEPLVVCDGHTFDFPPSLCHDGRLLSELVTLPKLQRPLWIEDNAVLPIVASRKHKRSWSTTRLVQSSSSSLSPPLLLLLLPSSWWWWWW